MRRTKHAKKRLRVHRAGADLDVERLLQRAAARYPEFRQLQDQILKGHLSCRTKSCATSIAGPDKARPTARLSARHPSRGVRSVLAQVFRPDLTGASPSGPAPISAPCRGAWQSAPGAPLRARG